MAPPCHRPLFVRSFVRSFARSLARWRARRENFSSTRKFRQRENFGKKSSGRRDRFHQQIIEIGAILAIFEPFENSRFLGRQLLVAPKSQSLTTSRSKKLVANC